MCSSGTFYLYFTIKALTAEIKPLVDLFFSKVQTQTHGQGEIVGEKKQMIWTYKENKEQVIIKWDEDGQVAGL